MKSAQSATTGSLVVHSVAELKMALADKGRGQRIAQLRKRRHLTQQAMAERLRIGYRTYQTWEAGRMPEWHNIEKLAKFHGVRPEDVIGDEEPPVDPSQLDRIEGKLDELLALLKPAAETLAAAFEAEADRLDEQRKPPAAKPKRTRRSEPGR